MSVNFLAKDTNTPKSQAGNRIIPMTEKVKEAFLMEKRLQEDAGITCDISIDGYTDFVFLNRFGKVQTMSMLNKALKRIMRDCNDQILSNAEEDEDVVLLPPFSCHVLRHTFATRLCESGMNIYAGQKDAFDYELWIEGAPGLGDRSQKNVESLG